MAELFERFEIDRVPRWPLLSRLFALSVVLHGVFFVAVTYAPTVQSLFSVAGSFAGVKFVEKDYDETLIGQRATLVKVSEPYEKLYYPTDYFGAPPAPEALPGSDPLFVQSVAPPPAPIIRPRPVVRPNPTPTPEATPEASPTPAASPEVAQASDAEKKKTEEELDRIAKENNTPRPPGEKEINLKPLKDVLEMAKQMVSSGQVSLNDTIEMTVEADRNEDGSLENINITRAEGDEDANKLAEEFLKGLSASKALVFLNDTRHMTMTVRLDRQTVFVSVTTEADTEARAAQMSLGYSTMVAIARKGKKGTDEGEIYNNLNVSSEGRKVLMQFQMPREVAGAMLAKVKTTE